MMQVLTQTFVYSFLTGFVVYAFWLYVTYKTIDTLIRLVENKATTCSPDTDQR